LGEPTPPLKVLIHVPKTAGSALNAHLLRVGGAQASPKVWPLVAKALPDTVIENSVAGRYLSRGFARGYSHLEFLENRPEVLKSRLQSADWVSGHIARDVMEDHLAKAGREAQLYTVVRDPVAQLASHYQWWIEIYRRGPWRYLRYNNYFRGLSRDIRATDNSDPLAVIEILKAHAPLFLNFQHSYVVGDLKINTALERFAEIGVDSQIDGVAQAMTGQRMPERRINASTSILDRDVFKTAQMTAFLAEHHAKDIALYDAVS